MKNGYGEITQYIYGVGLWFLGSIFPLIAIHLYTYTKFYLNANSSFKVICRTKYRTDGQSGDFTIPPSWCIKETLRESGEFTTAEKQNVLFPD